MESWLFSKKAFIDAMNGELIIESNEPVTFSLTEKAKSERINEFCDIIAGNFDLTDLAEFIDRNRETFYENKVEFKDASHPEIQPGSKLVKAFKYFIPDENTCRFLQDKASMIIQEVKITGTLCISVHPLDFLSLSENTYHWRSCHALDGEYRMGNLSYMQDSSTAIVYLKGEDDVELPNFPESVRWNSKKWRMLLYFSEDWNTIIAGRQYPFNSEQAMQILHRFIATNLIPNVHYTPWENEYIMAWPEDNETLNDKYARIRNRLFGLRNMVRDCQRPQHYNDVLFSSCYKRPYYMYSNLTPLNEELTGLERGQYTRGITTSLAPKIRVGVHTPCICCGEDFHDTDSMVCDNCYRE